MPRKLQPLYPASIRGVLGDNPDRAEMLIARMLTMDPSDHWVLVRAIAYSGLPDWRELLATFVDRMATRRAMIDQYLDGKLPTLDRIDYQTAKPGMLDKIKVSLRLEKDKKNPAALEPTPGIDRRVVGLLSRHQQLRADREGDQAPAALNRQGQCRQPDRRQCREIHARQQRGARYRIAADAQMGGQGPATRT